MKNRLFGSILCWLGFHDFHVITHSALAEEVSRQLNATGAV
jgi:hypothetical protein